MTKKIEAKYMGFFWHIHHNILVEWSDDINERIGAIKKNKPQNEIPIRLKLLKKVKGKLPKEFIEADKARDKADKALDKAKDKAYKADKALDKAKDKAFKAWNKADKAKDKAFKAWNKADKALDKADKALDKARDNKQIIKLHNKECGCKEWTGKEIVFG